MSMPVSSQCTVHPYMLLLSPEDLCRTTWLFVFLPFLPSIFCLNYNGFRIFFLCVYVLWSPELCTVLSFQTIVFMSINVH
jgi:hypothetical protein